MIPRDKLGHMAAGVGAAALGAGVWVMAYAAGLAALDALPIVLLVGPIAAAAAKEYADWMDNRAAAAAGRPAAHGVELLDALATALPGAVLALAALWVLPRLAI